MRPGAFAVTPVASTYLVYKVVAVPAGTGIGQSIRFDRNQAVATRIAVELAREHEVDAWLLDADGRNPELLARFRPPE